MPFVVQVGKNKHNAKEGFLDPSDVVGVIVKVSGKWENLYVDEEEITFVPAERIPPTLVQCVDQIKKLVG